MRRRRTINPNPDKSWQRPADGNQLPASLASAAQQSQRPGAGRRQISARDSRRSSSAPDIQRAPRQQRQEIAAFVVEQQMEVGV
jgi:hypothetical protein